jgi:hypothetical protein
VQFNLVSAVVLGAGTYWLELHEGPTLSTDDGTGIGWELSANTGNAKQGLASNGIPQGTVNNEYSFQLYDTAFGAAAVPEPSSVVLMFAGLAAMCGKRVVSMFHAPHHAPKVRRTAGDSATCSTKA